MPFAKIDIYRAQLEDALICQDDPEAIAAIEDMLALLDQAITDDGWFTADDSWLRAS